MDTGFGGTLIGQRRKGSLVQKKKLGRRRKETGRSKEKKEVRREEQKGCDCQAEVFREADDEFGYLGK